MRSIVLIVHNVRSALNVGSILRTADGFGVQCVYLSGYTPYPVAMDDKRLPHVASRAQRQIAKTALGAEKTVKWQPEDNVLGLVNKLKKRGFLIVALEQTKKSVNLPDFQKTGDVALIIGSEIGGIEPKLLKAAEAYVQIPMTGAKESFNVAIAAAVALYHLRYVD